MKKHGGKVENEKYKLVYTGLGGDMSMHDAIIYGKSIGFEKAYYGCDDDTGKYNGDTAVLYNDKNDLPKEYMKIDAERAEAREEKLKQALQMNVAPPSDPDKDIVININARDVFGGYAPVGLAGDNGTGVVGYVPVKDKPESRNGTYALNLGKPSDKHSVFFDYPAYAVTEMTANEISQMHDKSEELHRAAQERFRQNDEERVRQAAEKVRQTESYSTEGIPDMADDTFHLISEDDLPF